MTDKSKHIDPPCCWKPTLGDIPERIEPPCRDYDADRCPYYTACAGISPEAVKEWRHSLRSECPYYNACAGINPEAVKMMYEAIKRYVAWSQGDGDENEAGESYNLMQAALAAAKEE